MKEDALPDEWFCNVCATSRLLRMPEMEKGVFGPLLFNLDRKNPTAFRLPKHVREYFADVKMGPEGEYDEGAPPKPK
jgi:hypothetical protein